MNLVTMIKHLIFRISVILLLATILWMGKDPLIRSAIIYRVQKFTGAKVEIQQLNTNWDDGRLFLKNLKVADARNPMFNLFQADLAYLKFDLQQLKHRRVVIEEGRLIGLVFNAPRTETGVLNPTGRQLADSQGLLSKSIAETTEITTGQTSSPVVKRDLSETLRASKSWINQQHPQNSSFDWEPAVDPRFANTVQQIQQVSQRQLDHLSKQVAELAPEFTDIQNNLSSQHFPNPLRDNQRYSKARDKIDLLSAKGDEIKKELISELQKLAAIRQDLIDQTNVEIASIDKISVSHTFQADLINRLLLHQEQQEIIDEILSSFIQFRQAIPNPQSLSALVNSPAEVLDQNFRLPNTTSLPKFIVKKLELEGSGRFANRFVNFVGTIDNLTTEPQINEQATTIQLRALGKRNLMVRYTLKFDSDRPLEHLEVQWPELDLPEKQLGHQQSLLASIAPNRQAFAKIDLNIDGDEIRGKFVLQHSNVVLHFDQLHESLGGNEVRIRLNNGLSQINRFKTESTLNGTLHDYQITIESDLGNQLVELADQVINDRIEQQKEKRKLEITKQVEGVLHHLDQTYKTELTNLISQLEREMLRVSELESSIESNSPLGWKKIR